MRLLRHMPQDYRVYGFRARGADGVTPPHASVEAMLKDYLAEMQTLQPEGPYFLIGDCIGGVVAYEAARRLQTRGQRIATLILLDSERPTKRKYYAYRLDELRKGIAARIEYRWKKARKSSSEQLQDDINPQKRLNALGEVHRRNLRRYRSGAYDGGVKLVVNAEWFQRDQTLGWAKIARGGVESYAAPGDHFTFRNAGEHAAEVARQITKWITAAREGNEYRGAERRQTNPSRIRIPTVLDGIADQRESRSCRYHSSGRQVYFG